AAQGAALGEQAGAGGAVDRAVDPAAPEQGGVRGVHDRVDALQPGDVPAAQGDQGCFVARHGAPPRGVCSSGPAAQAAGGSSPRANSRTCTLCPPSFFAVTRRRAARVSTGASSVTSSSGEPSVLATSVQLSPSADSSSTPCWIWSPAVSSLRAIWM